LELSLPEDTGRKIANLIILSSASLVTLDPTSVVSAAFPIILQYAPDLLGEFVKSAVFSEAWNALKRIFGKRKRKGEVSDQEVLQYLGYLKDNEEELKELMSEIQDTLEELTKKREDCALEMVAIFKDLISQEEFKKQISADISDRLQAGLNSYLEELVGRVSEENKRELEKLREEIFLSLQTIARKDLKELREDKDLEDPSVNIISDRILVESEYLRTVAGDVIAKAHDKRLVFIVGEAGIGKSKLLYSIWKKLKERKEEVAYLLNFRETPLYHGVLFYDDFKSNYFDPLMFPALTTRKLVITIRDFEYEKLRSNNMEFKTLEDSGAVLHVYLNKEALEREFLLKLAEKYLEAHELKVSEEVVDKIVAKSERLPIYITTLIEHCASTGVEIEEFIEKVPSGIFKLIGKILLSTFYKPPEIEVWSLSTLVALAHWQGLMHEKHLEALKSELRKLDDSVKCYDLSQYDLLNKVGSFYRFKHWTWGSVLSAIYDGDLEEFGDLKDNLEKLQKYLRHSELDFDALLKASYFNALDATKDRKEKLELFWDYLLSYSRYFFDLSMYANAVEKLKGFYEKNKAPEIAVVFASGLANLIPLFGESRELNKAEEMEARLNELYKIYKIPDIAILFATGLFNSITYLVITYPGKREELKKAEEKEARLNEIYKTYKIPEIVVLFSMGLVNMIAGFGNCGDLRKAEEKETRLKELYEESLRTPVISLEIAFVFAKGLCNLTVDFGKSGDLKKAEEKETRLKELYEAHETPEIAVALAKGIVTLIVYYCKSEDLKKAEEKEATLKALYEESHRTPGIAVWFAAGLYSLIMGFCKSGNLKRAEEKEATLIELYEAHKTPEIAFLIASRLVNLIAGFSDSGELRKAEEKEARLKELYEVHRTLEIAVLFASGLVNLTKYFGEIGDLKKAEEKEVRLKELYEVRRTPEITVLLARGLFNLLTSFSMKGELEKAEEKEARLNELHEVHKNHEIAVWFARGLYNLIFAFKLRNEIDKCLNYCDKLSELSVQHESLEISEIYTKALNLISEF
jgi:hypothetical protein